MSDRLEDIIAHINDLSDPPDYVHLRELATEAIKSLQSQLSDLQSAFDDRVKVIKMQCEDKEKLKSQLSAAQERCEGFAEVALGNAQELGAIKLKLLAMEKERDKWKEKQKARFTSHEQTLRKNLDLQKQIESLKETIVKDTRTIWGKGGLKEKLTASEKRGIEHAKTHACQFIGEA